MVEPSSHRQKRPALARYSHLTLVFYLSKLETAHVGSTFDRDF
jgi:hypothetical protein